MGCDIHAHSELKIEGKWYHLDSLNIDRNYALFAKMADVRNNWDKFEPISKPKGLPKDASFMTKFLCAEYGSDGHSHSYLTSKEFMKLSEWAKEHWGEFWAGHKFYSPDHFGYLFGYSYEEFFTNRNDMPKELDDFRFVFWFDN